jgi:RNA polymerase sigma-70 factor (ECF subfamily)
MASATATMTVTPRNDQAEFEALMQRTKRQAYNMAYRMTSSRDDAHDLTQEAYLRAYRSFDKYDRNLPFENWFFRILSNLFVDTLRRKPKLQSVSLDRGAWNTDGDDEFVPEIASPDGNPEDILMRGIMDERLQNALAALPVEFRRAVLLCDVEDLSYEEIAARMGTSIGTVRSRIHRGRVLLRKLMQGPVRRRNRELVIAQAAA